MSQTDRSELKQIAERGSRDWSEISDVLDSAFLAQVGFVQNSQPFVIPMVYGRRDQSLFLHGAASSRIAKTLAKAAPVCVCITLIDGIVLAKTAFNHSMNYRSVVAFGTAHMVTDARAKVAALRTISEHLLSGRWDDVRGPNRSELAQTTVIEIPIAEALLKSRSGPPGAEPDERNASTWTGVLPLELRALSPIRDSQCSDALLPPYLRFPDLPPR